MKFIHISDLHLGKIIYGVSMIDNRDQVVWVEKFLERVQEIRPDAVVIAGDVYDRSSPSGDAVQLLDRLLTGITDMGIPVLMVAGNHDSGERLSFAKSLLSKSHVYIEGKLEKKMTSITIPSEDGSDEITFWLLPYVFPSLVSHVLEDDSIREYDEAVRRLLAAQKIDFTKKNVLVAHQNVTAFGNEVQRGGSESMVGGVGQIDYAAFDGFTYVALGHIHSAYSVGRPEVRYAGTPLCYHFDEVRQPNKGPLLVEVAEDGAVSITLEKIEPLHPMRRLEDSYENILKDLEENRREGEYLRIVVQDQKLTPAISSYLRDLCRNRGTNLMELLSDYKEFSSSTRGASREEVEEKSVEELFYGFYKDRRAEMEPEEEEVAILKEAGDILRHAGAEGAANPSDKAVDRLFAFIMKQEG